MAQLSQIAPRETVMTPPGATARRAQPPPFTEEDCPRAIGTPGPLCPVRPPRSRGSRDLLSAQSRSISEKLAGALLDSSGGLESPSTSCTATLKAPAVRLVAVDYRV